MSNHLANQSSPYLLQHASNPVDWYPWGQEAFDAAAQIASGFQWAVYTDAGFPYTSQGFGRN